MKKAAFLFWHLGIGGVGTRLKDIVEFLNKQENTKVKPILLLKENQREIDFPAASTFYFSEKINTGRKFSFFWWLVLKLLSERPIYVVAFLNRFALVAVIYKLLSLLSGRQVKVVINQTVMVSNYLKQYESFYWRWLIRWSFSWADMVVVNSAAIKKELMGKYRLKPQKIKIIRSWVKIARTEKKIKKKYDAMFVGRLSPEKGIDTLLDTAEILRDRKPSLTMAIVGDGDLRDWLLEELEQRNLTKNVDYLGYKKTPRNLLKKAKLLLLPSRNEGLPMVILEAYSVSVPAIVTPFLGADEVVEDKITGLIVARKNFPRQTAKLLQNKNRLQKMSVQAKRKAKEDFSLKNRDRFIEEIFKD